jgi:ribosomal protein S18 acetylase RimI-like enzyme
MGYPDGFRPAPWDTDTFGIEAFEIDDPSPDRLALASRMKGHYTVKVDPLSSKQALHEHGFYYCDTLLEPYCEKGRFIPRHDDAATTERQVGLEPLLGICHGAFSHGRFHRDFRIPAEKADLRYDRWLAQLHAGGKVLGLMYGDRLAGFIAHEGGRLVLHAIDAGLRGRGLAKYLWTTACQSLFEEGHSEVTSSVSASNLSVMNLYISLGFRLRNPVDIYHRLTI